MSRPFWRPRSAAALLTITSWRGIFVVLALAAVGLWLLALLALPETLPVERRQTGSVRGSLRAYSRLFHDRLFVTMVLVAGLMFATVFAYIAGAPFILQGPFGLSAQQFGVAFSANAVGMIADDPAEPGAGAPLRADSGGLGRRA